MEKLYGELIMCVIKSTCNKLKWSLNTICVTNLQAGFYLLGGDGGKLPPPPKKSFTEKKIYSYFK